jgi:hypothetical protein
VLYGVFAAEYLLDHSTYMDAFDFTTWMVGRQIVGVALLEPSMWVFSFGDTLGISAECPWRLLQKGSIVISGDDHRQQYGLPAPVDAAERAASLLAGAVVRHVEVRNGTADLLVDFERDLRLEVIPFSSGYESWKVSAPGGKSIVAQGGGQLSAW